MIWYRWLIGVHFPLGSSGGEVKIHYFLLIQTWNGQNNVAMLDTARLFSLLPFLQFTSILSAKGHRRHYRVTKTACVAILQTAFVIELRRTATKGKP